MLEGEMYYEKKKVNRRKVVLHTSRCPVLKEDPGIL